MLMVCWSPKGGSGTSVVSVGLAIAASRLETRTLIVDIGGDVPAILGMSESPIGLSEWIAQPSAFDIEELFVDGPAGLKVLPSGSSSLPDAVSSSWARLGSELHRLSRSGWTVVIDGARNLSPDSLGPCDVRTLIVVRPCYLSIRRGRLARHRSDGIVFVAEPERVLTPSDVEAVLGTPVVAVVPMRPDISRRIDAGVIAERPPSHLIDALSHLVEANDSVR